MGGRARHQRRSCCCRAGPRRCGRRRRPRPVARAAADPLLARHVDLRRSTVSLTAADVAEIMRLLESPSFDELTLEMDGAEAEPAARRRAVTARGRRPRPLAAATSRRADAGTPAARSAAAAPAAQPASRRPIQRAGCRRRRCSAPSTARPNPARRLSSRSARPSRRTRSSRIIEVMKLMNTVRAGVRGTVTEILPRDGALVEYGETLLRVRKAG